MRKLVFFLAGMLWSFAAHAQEGRVRVTDAVTGRPLPYADLCFVPLHGGRQRCTVSDAEGWAQVRCDDSCVVTVTMVGYRPLQDTLPPSGAFSLLLHPDLLHLEQVVVTATRTPKSLKEVPVITQVVERRTITAEGLSTVREVLAREIPGISFQRGGFGPDMKMQGLSAKNVLILVDGERLAGETGYNIDYSRLNTADIERIEVVKGAASALYGSQAMGGVINIITRETREPWEMNASLRWGTPNERNFPARSRQEDPYHYERHLDLFNYDLHLAGGVARDHFTERTLIVAKSFDAYRLYDEVPVEKHYLSVDTVITEKLNPFPTGIPGYRDWQFDQKVGLSLSPQVELHLHGGYYHHDEFDFVPDKVHQRYRDVTAGGKMAWTPGERFRLEGAVHYDAYSKYDHYEKLGEDHLHYRNIFWDPRLLAEVRWRERHTLTAGTEFFSDQLFSDRLFGDTAAYRGNTTFILFLQEEARLGPQWDLTVGVRLDRHDVFGTHLSPKLSLMYKLKPLTFRLNYARGFRSPSVKELYIDWHVAWFTIRGNQELRPETNHYLSASAEVSRPWFDIALTAYSNHLRDKIEGMWKENQTVYQYFNVSEVSLNGLEVTARLRPVPSLSLDAGYSYVRDRRPQGELVSAVSPHSGTVKASWNFRKRFYRLRTTLAVNITGAKDYLMSDRILFRGERVEAWYPVHFDPWAIWRLTVSQRFRYGIRLTAGVDNLFDHTPRVVSFNTSMSPGRTAFLTLAVDFGKMADEKEK